MRDASRGARDPEYAEAWALQVVIHGQYIWNSFDDSPERLAAMRDALDNANRYGLGKAEVLAAQAEYYYRVENDFHAAERALEAVIKSRPGDATFRKLMALTQRRTYKFEESISSFEAAIELDPGDAQGRTMLIETLLMMNEGQRAMPLLKRWVEAFPEARDLKALQVDALFYGFGDLERARKLFNQIEPLAGNTYFNTGINLTMLERDYPATLTFVAHPALASLRESVGFGAWMKLTEGMAHKLMNDDSSARELARQSIALMDAAGKSTSILNQSQVLTARAYAHFILNDIDKALELSNEAYTMFPESRDSVTGYQHAYTRAWLLGLAGQREAALEEVARLLNSPSGTTRWFLQLHPDWDYFRDDERFNELVRPDNLEDAVL
jgi:tetratricopeptide (TPR) repeat protein